MTEILVDTSFLMKLLSSPTPSFGRVEAALGKPSFLVLEDVLAELRSLSRAQGRKSREAKAALQYAGNLRLVTLASAGSTDEKILSYAVGKKVVVATSDRELRMRLRRMGVPVVSFRGREVFLEGVT